MKLTAKLVWAAALCASVGVVCAWADDANSVSSANAIGVVKYTIPANGGLTLVSLPLDTMSTNAPADGWYWTDTSLAEQLPKGSTIYLWNTEKMSWENFGKSLRTGKWDTNLLTRPIASGEAFFLCGPSSATEDFTISLLGELPTDQSLSYELIGDENFNVRAVSMYPVDTVFVQSSFASNLPRGSSVYFWTGSAWDNDGKSKRTGNWGSDTNRIVKTGEGVFVTIPGSSTNLTMNRPFEWE